MTSSITTMVRFPVSQTIRAFARRFFEQGFQLYIVGGAVRDFLLGRKITDYDFATDAVPEQVIDMFSTVIPTGMKHGTVTVRFHGESYEVTTFRIEGDYHDRRHPESVTFIRSLEQDLSRRDFTVNALAADAADGTIIDLHEGLQDLQKGLIRAIGDPVQRFEEDALRIVRACRFACQLHFSVDSATLSAMSALADSLSHISGERLKIELFKMLEADRPSIGLELMKSCRAVEILFPELHHCIGVEQKGMHRHDVWYHSIYACDAAPIHKPLVRLAALLHDIGKPVVVQHHENERPTFYHHDSVSVAIARSILTRLKCSNDERDTVLNLVANHMFHYDGQWSDGAVRRFVGRVTVDALEDLFDLRLADQIATTGSRNSAAILEFKERIRLVLESGNALTVKDLEVNGNDLARLGIPKGPAMGTVLQELLETVLDDPKQNTKERLSEIAVQFYRQRIQINKS
ncbi:MAG: HD domain-containing protein [Sphaerochaetaceae bacterium]|jgi:putative nucleotidyltransferase with HDIG domain|nr:HD domain-containing protein [Sphaerochaetaceae bacterium]